MRPAWLLSLLRRPSPGSSTGATLSPTGARATAPAEFGRYALASAVAGSVNLGAYVAALWLTGAAWPWPYIALATGVAAGLAVNFLLYDRIVFRGSRNR